MNNKNRKKFNIYLSIFAVAAIIATMFFSGLVVHADGLTLGEKFDITSDNCYLYNNLEPSIDSVNGGLLKDRIITQNSYFVNNLIGNKYDLSSVDSSYSDFNNYFITGYNSIQCWFLPSDSFCVYSISNNRVYLLVDYDTVLDLNGKTDDMGEETSVICDYYNFNFDSSGNYVNSSYYRASRNYKELDEGNYYYMIQNLDNLLSSNIPFYIVDDFGSFTTTDGLTNYNSNTFSGSGGLSKADIEANSLLKNGTKIYLTNNSFNVGDLIIYPVLTQTQKNNPNNFKLRLTGTCTYGIQYNSDALNMLQDGNGNYLFSMYPMTDNTINSVRGTLTSSSGSYIDYSFSELLSGKKSITLDQLNSHFAVSGRDNGIQPLASGLDHTFGGYTYWTNLASLAGNVEIKNFKFDFSKILDQSRYDCIPTSAHYIIEAWVVANGVQASNPTAVIDVDLVTGELQPIVENYATDEQIMSALGTDILPAGYANANAPVSPNYMQGAITNSANASSGGAGGSGGNSNSNSNIESGAIVINNNPTFNNKNDLSSDGNSGLIPFILGLIAGNQKASTSTVENISNTDGWLSIMNTTFSFVPAGVWTLLIGAFTAAIGIMIVSFILSIIIKFIT